MFPSEINTKSPIQYNKYIKSPQAFDRNQNHGTSPSKNLPSNFSLENPRPFLNPSEFPENGNFLLMKCQSTIQDLQMELDKTNKEKVYFKEKLDHCQKHSLELETKCNQEKFLKEKFQGFFYFFHFITNFRNK